MAFKMVRYKLQTLLLVDLEARATGAGSVLPSAAGAPSAEDGGVMSGNTVERASGRRRVRKSWEA